MTTPSGHTSAIRGKKVLGTTVKNTAGETLGSVEDIVLDKRSNNIMFAVLSFGGFLGIGEKYHPIPWSSLNYDQGQDAYVVSFSKDQLESAPADTIEELTKNDGRLYRERSYDYYHVERDWR